MKILHDEKKSWTGLPSLVPVIFHLHWTLTSYTCLSLRDCWVPGTESSRHKPEPLSEHIWYRCPLAQLPLIHNPIHYGCWGSTMYTHLLSCVCLCLLPAVWTTARWIQFVLWRKSSTGFCPQAKISQGSCTSRRKLKNLPTYWLGLWQPNPHPYKLCSCMVYDKEGIKKTLTHMIKTLTESFLLELAHVIVCFLWGNSRWI